MDRYPTKHDVKVIAVGAAISFLAFQLGRSVNSDEVKLNYDMQVVANSGDGPESMAKDHCKDNSRVGAAITWIEDNNMLPIQPTQAVNVPNC